MKHNKQVGTKGILNVINERYGTNQKRRSVPIQDLIRYHKPTQQAELIALIEAHTSTGSLSKCKCGCKSAGKLEDFADNLYEAYGRYLKEVDNTIEYKDWDDCYIFMKNLFVINSLRGNDMENKVVKSLRKFIELHYSDHHVKYRAELATEVHDFKFAVDISFFNDTTGEEIFGVQVKPLTYKNFPTTHTVVQQNLTKNKLYGKPVVYIYYDEANTIHSAHNVASELKECFCKYETTLIPKLD